MTARRDGQSDEASQGFYSRCRLIRVHACHTFIFDRLVVVFHVIQDGEGLVKETHVQL